MRLQQLRDLQCVVLSRGYDARTITREPRTDQGLHFVVADWAVGAQAPS